MQENYINIYTKFLAGFLETEKISMADAYFLIKEFEPVCEQITSREKLVEFIEKYISKFPFLQELKNQLANNNHSFN